MTELYDIGIEKVTRLTVEKLEELELNIVLENPQANEDFPCGVVSNIMRDDILTENGVPVKSKFSITVEWWSNKTYSSMALFDNATKKLRELNMLLMNNTTSRYDEVTKKYVVGGIYEVAYNALTDSFHLVK